MQNYARKRIIAIDKLSYRFEVVDNMTWQEVKARPEAGCLVYGLYLEGCRWDATTHTLEDSEPKRLYTEMPMIAFVPEEDYKKPVTGLYECPVYKVLSRTGTLSTTGHSTNFVLNLDLPSNYDQDKWIRAGVAAFLSLKY